jgi:LysR family nitrogen assimilation transcriptional regulator
MSRRVVCATAVTRPSTAAGAAVVELMGDVVRKMVADGSWPARWIGGTGA